LNLFLKLLISDRENRFVEANIVSPRWLSEKKRHRTASYIVSCSVHCRAWRQAAPATTRNVVVVIKFLVIY